MIAALGGPSYCTLSGSSGVVLRIAGQSSHKPRHYTASFARYFLGSLGGSLHGQETSDVCDCTRHKNISYETVVELRDGQWSIVTYEDGKPLAGGGVTDYPFARGYQIGLIVINWWVKTFGPKDSPALPADLASARATWLSRAAHKLLTEVPDRSDQLAALRMLSSDYDIEGLESAAFPSTKAASWTASASQTLERAIPEESRPLAVAVLVEMITGVRGVAPATQGLSAAAP